MFNILPSMRETDLDLEESVFVLSSLLAPEAGVREDEPFGSCIVFSFGLAVKLSLLSERRLYFETALETLILGVVDNPDVVALVDVCIPKPPSLSEFSVASCGC